MAPNDNDYKKTRLINEDGDTDSDAGSGGSTGQIEFRDFIGGDKGLRDDMAPLTKEHLLKIHEATHVAVVKKQKDTLTERKNLKEGQESKYAYRNGLKGSVGGNLQYRNHPMLSESAQFSGIDKEVNGVPTLNEAKTNDDKRNELKAQPSFRNRPEIAPQYNPPKLRPI